MRRTNGRVTEQESTEVRDIDMAGTAERIEGQLLLPAVDVDGGDYGIDVFVGKLAVVVLSEHILVFVQHVDAHLFNINHNNIMSDYQTSALNNSQDISPSWSHTPGRPAAALPRRLRCRISPEIL